MRLTRVEYWVEVVSGVGLGKMVLGFAALLFGHLAFIFFTSTGFLGWRRKQYIDEIEIEIEIELTDC